MTSTPNDQPARPDDHSTDSAHAEALPTVPRSQYLHGDTCACGAESGADGFCAKCRSRARWQRRQSSRTRAGRRPEGRAGRRPAR